MPRERWLTPNNAPAGTFTCRVLRIPRDPEYVAIITGALLNMSYPWMWDDTNGQPADDTALVYQAILDGFQQERCMIGAIFPYMTTNPPPGCLKCDGTHYLKADYPLLAAALDTAFSVDSTHFAVPNLVGNVPVGANSGATGRHVGDIGGEAVHTLTTAELATHAHSIAIFSPVLVAPGAVPVGTLGGPSVASTGNAGSGTAHNNMQPFLCLNYCVVAS